MTTDSIGQKMIKSQSSNFQNIEEHPKLIKILDSVDTIIEEYGKLNLELMPIDRIDKSHQQVLYEVMNYVSSGGQYGWIKGWGTDSGPENWTQLALIYFDQAVPFITTQLPQTIKILSDISGIKLAAFVKMNPNTLLRKHDHPELKREGLLQMHLTLEAARVDNYSYINIEGEFKQHHLRKGFVFDGSHTHFAFNASDSDRTILYLSLIHISEPTRPY